MDEPFSAIGAITGMASRDYPAHTWIEERRPVVCVTRDIEGRFIPPTGS